MTELDKQVDVEALGRLLDPASPVAAVWAKTNMRDPSDLRWLALPQHAADTMLVAGKIWDEFLAAHVKTLLAEALGGENDARRVTMFLAGCHDVGKATPAFEKQARGETGERRLKALEAVGLTIDPETVSSSLRHETAGFKAMNDWIVEHTGIDKLTAARMSIVIGGHHGVYHLNTTYTESVSKKRREYGDDHWEVMRTTLINHVCDCMEVQQALRDLDWSKLVQPLQSVLTGLIVIADWIASSMPLTVNGLVSASDAQMRVNARWRDLDLQEPWRPTGEEIPFADMFALPDGTGPRPLQAEAGRLASTENGPFIMIMEAPMGVGKTEAALLAAYDCAKANGSGGVVFALPTRATANGILPRMVDWMDNVLDEQASFRLLHGTATFNETYRGLIEASSAQLYGEAPISAARINDWFNGRRQGLLASFVVCTIDQILMAALSSKHFDLKHLGLAGKTVIIDEVHAADDYMAVYLDRALEWLGALRCPVILLSATLPESRRNAMIESYMRGLKRLSPCEEVQVADSSHVEYPLITIGDKNGVRLHAVANYVADVEINVEWITGDGLDAVMDRIARGGCGAIIKNTVKGAQTVYREALESGRLRPDEIILMHSRFLPADRARKEQEILSTLGKDATLENGKRPKRLLVIGTQVLEQSLDIDFDVMCSDIAPVDLLLQRAGRLHRHKRSSRPAGLETPELMICGSTLVAAGEAPEFDGGSKAVYGGWRLMRTCAALMGKEKILLPSDIAPLVDYVYSDDDQIIPSDWTDAYSKAKEKHESEKLDKEQRASAYRLRNPFPGKRIDVIWGSNEKAKNQDEERGLAQVRDSDGSGLDVILLKRAGDGYAQLLVDDEQYSGMLISLDQSPDADPGIAIKIAEQKIGLPGELSGYWIVDETIKWAEKHCLIPAWQGSQWMNGELVLLLDESGKNILELVRNGKPYRVEVSYDRDLGLTCRRMETSD